MKTSVSPYRFSWFDWFCFWYPPGWLILFNRHWQHYYRDPEGWNGLEYGLFLLPGGFYLALLIRWLRLGCRPPRTQPAQPDLVYQAAFREEILAPIMKHYFRAELRQVENLPLTSPILIAMNHAGMCFPWDFIGLALLLSQKRGWFVQPLAHPIFFDHPWLVWWLPPGWVQVLGAVRAEKASFETAVAQKNILLYAPESWRGLAKGWGQRYHLASFDPSFIQLCNRYHVPVLPVVCMGSEYLHPWAFNVKPLARWFKLPMMPISILLLAFVFFPSMGVWAMRTRLHYYLEPVDQPWNHINTQKPRIHKHTFDYQLAENLRVSLQNKINQLRMKNW